MNVIKTFKVSDQVNEVLTLGSFAGSVQSTSQPSYDYTNGTSTAGTVAGVIDLHWELSGATAVTLASGASATYVLSALTDSQGRAVAFARVATFLLWLTSRTDGDWLDVGNAATHPWTAPCSSGTALLHCYDVLAFGSQQKAAYVVTSGSSDQVLVHNAGSHSITFGINISGCST